MGWFRLICLDDPCSCSFPANAISTALQQFNVYLPSIHTIARGSLRVIIVCDKWLLRNLVTTVQYQHP